MRYAQGVNCLGGGGVVFGVDADGVGEGEGRKRFKMWDEESGNVGKEDGVALEDLREEWFSGDVWGKGNRLGLRLLDDHHIESSACRRLVLFPSL